MSKTAAPFAHERVPNVANEATSLLKYILNHYDDLPSNIIFVHDEDASPHHRGKISENLPEWIGKYEATGGGYYEFNSFELIDKRGLQEDVSVLGFWKKCMHETFGRLVAVEPEYGKCCAQFIVSKRRILCRPRAFYKQLYDFLLAGAKRQERGSYLSERFDYNEYAGRLLEWSWRFIFNGANCTRPGNKEAARIVSGEL
eukprot:TRINITY_DN25128_c0_g1_i1.p1 TRINITY_DN25128_c0_g1~~TRINITY_DN25128_c0_g1_i1.p1  ORF type:complete len:200 (+),score=44.77 TRINITY_DN25128_c0_g1_i1:233-832(+)